MGNPVEQDNNRNNNNNTSFKCKWWKENRTEITVIVLVAVFILIFCAQNYLYIKQDGTRFSDFQTIMAADFSTYIFRNEKVLADIRYPPVTYLVTMCYFKIMGISQDTASLSLMVFWVMFLLSMYKIGSHFGDNYSGIAVMALSASSPFALKYSRYYYLDFPQTATTALAFYLLLKTDGFKNRRNSILFGFCMALALMTKWSAIFFLIFPILWFLIPLILRSKKAMKAFLIFFVTSLISMLGNYFYYKMIYQNQEEKSFWYINFLLSIIIPTGLNFLLSWQMDKKFKKDENYPNSPEYSIISFNYSSIPMSLFMGAWTSWAGKKLSLKFMAGEQTIRPLSALFRLMFEYGSMLKIIFSFAAVFLVIGIYFIVNKKRKEMFLTVFASALSFLLISVLTSMEPAICSEHTRYFFPVIIFFTPICGFWVAYTGWAKKYVTGVITVLSLLSILAWTFIPGNLPIYCPVKTNLLLPAAGFPSKILCTEPPNPLVIDFKEVLRHMKPDRQEFEQYSYYLIFTTRMEFKPIMILKEKLFLDTFETGKALGPTQFEFTQKNYITDIFYKTLHSLNMIKAELIEEKELSAVFSVDSLKELGTSNVLLLSVNEPPPPRLIENIRRHFKLTHEVKEFNIGGEYRVTLLRIENERR